jgi:hypothetical protein
MLRRRFLATTAALSVTAGCINSPLGDDLAAEVPTASLSMEAVDDAEIARTLAHGELPDEERAMVADVVENGTATFAWHQEPPVHTSRPVVHDGVVYDLSWTETDSRPVRNFSVKIDIPQTTPEPSETVRFADLPAADRAVFEREGFADAGPIGVGTTFTYTPEEVAESVLVPDPEYGYIRWEGGETAEWVVDDSWDARQKRYRYEAERMATATEYGADVRETYGFELSGLTDPERDIVRAAITSEHGYSVPAEATPSPALERLVDRFRVHDEVAVHEESEPDSGPSGDYVVDHDGTTYWTELNWEPRRTDTGD